jgi:DNA-binding response OmpR family regulator
MQEPRPVLVVDDDIVSLSGLLGLLREEGYRATGAATRETALRLLDVFRFDLVIVDLRLGRASGFDLVARARAGQSELSAIVIAANEDATAEREARLLGADYLVKPIAPSTLLALVRLRIDFQRSRAENRLH